MSTETKVRKVGSGRTKGSYSFVVLTVGEIKAKFADDSTPVIVSRKWAEPLGFDIASSKPAGSTTNAIQGLTPETKPNMRIVEL